jgi:hypothetical protein
MMITADLLSSWLADWDHPLGPFRTIEEVLDEMDASANALPPEEAPELAKQAAQFAREDHPRAEVLGVFLRRYGAHHPEAFAEALLGELAPDGPPLLVDLLGSTSLPSVPARAERILDLDRADKNLLVAWAGALGDLGGEDAKECLRRLERLPDLDDETKAEIAIARERLG